MYINDKATIYAQSTPHGKSGIAVIRLSGPKAFDALLSICKMGASKIKPRYAHYAEFHHPITREVIDKGLFLYFKNPWSFTGEDIVELQVHGGIAVVKDMLNALSDIEYLRPAEPGEFSIRAFKNCKLDLTMAEGLSDILNAETSSQRKMAMRQYDGELNRLYESWRKELVAVLALVEALLEFADDEVPREYESVIPGRIKHICDEIKLHINHSENSRVIVDGAHIVIYGPPNAGKSSLLNLLASSDVAIVSSTPGTTRDTLMVRIDLSGYMVTLYDTAGMRESYTDDIEKQGIERSIKALHKADIKILMFDAGDLKGYETFASDYKDSLSDATLWVLNKVDAADPFVISAITSKIQALNKEFEVLKLSTITKEGINDLLGIIQSKIAANTSHDTGCVITRARYKEALESCILHLDNAMRIQAIEMIAEEIRIAAHYIGTITGRICTEELLDEIFGSFCIGK